MTCNTCGSERIACVSGKTDERCEVRIDADGVHQLDYVPSGINIGSDSYLQFRFCLDCGMHQGQFPARLVSDEEDAEDEE